MDPEFARDIDCAAKIAAQGRGNALNDQIKYYAGVPRAAESWHFHLFSSLAYQVSSEYLLLKTAFYAPSRADAPLLAWRARNLLELMVWTLYFCRGEQNARRIYEDAGRDTRELIEAFEKWGKATAQPADWIAPLEEERNALLQRAAAFEIDSLDGTYKATGQAARECGIEQHYAPKFKLLSKFAHPTAVQIIAPPDKAKDSMQRDAFFSWGCLYFFTAFDCLESYLAGDQAPWKSTGQND